MATPHSPISRIPEIAVRRPFSTVIDTLNRNINATMTMPTLMIIGCSR